jgi:hypothetical protein
VPLPDLTTTPPALKPSPSRATTSSAEASTSPPTTSTATATTSTEPSPHASPVASSDDGSGPPWAGLAVGVAVVALLGGAALARARRTGGSS